MQQVRMLMQCLALVALAFPAAAARDERQLGKAAGYPIGTPASWFYDESVRVGSFSNLDRLLPHYTLKKAASPLPLPKAAGEPKFEYRFENQAHTLDDFLARQRVTGLLLIKEGEILLERYQYDRTPAHRFVSHSMAKSIVSIAVGMALAEGKIASLDDAVSKYAPKLAGRPYGETSIRNVLRMSSGVPFNEVYDGKDDLTRFSIVRRSQGSIAALRSFGGREVEQGTRFHYASSETVVLAVLLRAVTGTTLSEYLTERLWQPMGAEADATWVRSRDGLEIGSGSFNAILRDYAFAGMTTVVVADSPRLPLLGAQSRNTFSHPDDSRCLHLGAGNLLDLAGGERSVIDQKALAQPQIDDLLLARHLLRHGWRGERRQRKSAKQQKRKTLEMRDG